MTDFIPPWQDISTLCKHISCTPPTVEAWITQGILPPARMRGGKRMWKWTEVDAWLSNGKPGEGPVSDAERIRNATRAREERPRH